MAPVFEAELAISLLLIEATLSKTWTQKEGPKHVLFQVGFPCSFPYLTF